MVAAGIEKGRKQTRTQREKQSRFTEHKDKQLLYLKSAVFRGVAPLSKCKAFRDLSLGKDRKGASLIQELCLSKVGKM